MALTLNSEEIRRKMQERNEASASYVKGASKMMGRDSTTKLKIGAWVLKVLPKNKPAGNSAAPPSTTYNLFIGCICKDPNMDEAKATTFDGYVNIKPAIIGQKPDGKRGKIEPPVPDLWHSVHQFTSQLVSLPESLVFTPGQFITLSRIQVSWCPPRDATDIDFSRFDEGVLEFTAYLRADTAVLDLPSGLCVAHKVMSLAGLATSFMDNAALVAYNLDITKKYGKELKWIVTKNEDEIREALTKPRGAVADFIAEGSEWSIKSESKGDKVIAGINWAVEEWFDGGYDGPNRIRVLVRTFTGHEQIVAATGVSLINDWENLGPVFFLRSAVSVGGTENLENASRMDINGHIPEDPEDYRFGVFIYSDIFAVDVVGTCRSIGVPCTAAYANKWLSMRPKPDRPVQSSGVRGAKSTFLYVGSSDFNEEALRDAGEPVEYRVIVCFPNIKKGFELQEKYSKILTAEDGDALLLKDASLRKKFTGEEFDDYYEFETLTKHSQFKYVFAVFPRRESEYIQKAVVFYKGIQTSHFAANTQKAIMPPEPTPEHDKEAEPTFSIGAEEGTPAPTNNNDFFTEDIPEISTSGLKRKRDEKEIAQEKRPTKKFKAADLPAEKAASSSKDKQRHRVK